jgi:hypothetical protein
MRIAMSGRGNLLNSEARMRANEAIRKEALKRKGKRRKPEDIAKSRDAMLVSVDEKYGFVS